MSPTDTEAFWIGRYSPLFIAVLLSGGISACAARHATPREASATRITHGVAAGEVSATGAVIWGRCDGNGTLHVTMSDGTQTMAVRTAVTAAADYTGQIAFNQLHPATAYTYQAWCNTNAGSENPPPDSTRGTLRTAPDPHAAAPLQFVWGGDVGGQNVCRDRQEGYGVFSTIAALQPDFFIGLGDMIYADDPCAVAGRYGNVQVPGPLAAARDRRGFWEYWKYNRDDEALRRLLAATPSYAVWDDHEVCDDFGPQHDQCRKSPSASDPHLLPAGRAAFRDYNPLPGTGDAPFYRTIRWGQQVELFLLDTRSYRDANSANDDPRHPKTMLGAQQRSWLEEQLQRSDATWKIIVSSVPLSIPTGSADRGNDGWANGTSTTGFEHELLEILRFMQSHGIQNQLWISTDIHSAAVFRDTPFSRAPGFELYEIDTGPLNAGVFARDAVDPTLHPKRLFRYPETSELTGGFAQAKTWFNFGQMRIDANGRLTIGIINAVGKRLYTLTLRPHAASRAAARGGAARHD